MLRPVSEQEHSSLTAQQHDIADFYCLSMQALILPLRFRLALLFLKSSFQLLLVLAVIPCSAHPGAQVGRAGLKKAVKRAVEICRDLHSQYGGALRLSLADIQWAYGMVKTHTCCKPLVSATFASFP